MNSRLVLDAIRRANLRRQISNVDFMLNKLWVNNREVAVKFLKEEQFNDAFESLEDAPEIIDNLLKTILTAQKALSGVVVSANERGRE